MVDVRTLYRQNAAGGATPVGQVIALYEQIVEDLRRAETAIDETQIERRTHAINHALLVIGHLESKLNRQVGGKIAQALDHFYVMSRRRLLEAQLNSSKTIVEEQIALWLDLRDAWTQVDRAEAAHPPAAAASTGSTSGTGWSG